MFHAPPDGCENDDLHDRGDDRRDRDGGRHGCGDRDP